MVIGGRTIRIRDSNRMKLLKKFIFNPTGFGEVQKVERVCSQEERVSTVMSEVMVIRDDMAREDVLNIVLFNNGAKYA